MIYSELVMDKINNCESCNIPNNINISIVCYIEQDEEDYSDYRRTMGGC